MVDITTLEAITMTTPKSITTIDKIETREIIPIEPTPTDQHVNYVTSKVI